MSLHEKCGVFGTYGIKDAARVVQMGLLSLQHRGQESAGIVVTDGRTFLERKGSGLVSEVLTAETLSSLKGHIALGHVRYSTTGSSSSRNIQPFLGECRYGSLAVAHNGNLTNTLALWKKLSRDGAVFQSSMDTEMLLHLIARSRFDGLEDAIKEALWQIRGALSAAIMSRDRLVAVRDPWGFRPLALGRKDGGYLVSSETCALEVTDAEFIREIEPGEMLVIDKNGPRSFFYAHSRRKAFCFFELIYFSRPDSICFGESVYQVRKNLGTMLARQEDQEADMVIPVPESGIYAALGFSKESGLPLEFGLVRNSYIGRTFIRPGQENREWAVRMKLDPVKQLIQGKRIIVIEDSIVRGSTSRRRIATLKEAGAREVHMRVTSPPHAHPCYYGIDFPTREELIAGHKNCQGVMEALGLDSLRYVTVQNLMESLPGGGGHNYCYACFDGDYPVIPDKGLGKTALETTDRLCLSQ
ncbi:MAG TPA: amidophosphoribosyltransferase [Atribacteraceae bacterium]|nr:amidophosphoribosyltransferase [Atribacteraceae bacterium]